MATTVLDRPRTSRPIARPAVHRTGRRWPRVLLVVTLASLAVRKVRR